MHNVGLLRMWLIYIGHRASVNQGFYKKKKKYSIQNRFMDDMKYFFNSKVSENESDLLQFRDLFFQTLWMSLRVRHIANIADEAVQGPVVRN